MSSTTIFEAATNGDTAAILTLLENDPSLATAFSDEGWTALHLAAHYGQMEVAHTLISHGAEVNAVSKNGLANQPIHAAAAGQRTALIRLLLDHGAQVNAKEHGGYTPLQQAADSGDLEMIEVLLAHGAKVAETNDAGQTALDIATHKGFTVAADKLRKRSS